MTNKILFIFLVILSISAKSLSQEMTGKEIFLEKCSNCHNIKSEYTDNRELKAPPIDALTRQLKYYFRRKDEFINFVYKYVIEPSPENSVCLPCVNRWGVMPPQKDLKEEEIKSIALWMFMSFK